MGFSWLKYARMDDWHIFDYDVGLFAHAVRERAELLFRGSWALVIDIIVVRMCGLMVLLPK